MYSKLIQDLKKIIGKITCFGMLKMFQKIYYLKNQKNSLIKFVYNKYNIKKQSQMLVMRVTLR